MPDDRLEDLLTLTIENLQVLNKRLARITIIFLSFLLLVGAIFLVAALWLYLSRPHPVPSIQKVHWT